MSNLVILRMEINIQIVAGPSPIPALTCPDTPELGLPSSHSYGYGFQSRPAFSRICPVKGMVDKVRIFEKNIFPGGRISSFCAGEYEFNHGAQYFTVNNPLFWNIVSAWQSDGIVRPWDGWIVELQKGQIINSDMETQRFIGVPRMQTIVENLARHCDLSTSANISELEHQDSGGWRLFNERGDYQGAFDIVIIATAANQVADLCRSTPLISKAADNVDMTVCWSGMFSFDRTLNLPYDAAFVLDSPLSWISRYQRAPGSGDAEAEADCWVLHASPEWSQQYAASFRGRVMNALLDAFWEAVDLGRSTRLAKTRCLTIAGQSAPAVTGVPRRVSREPC